MGPSSRTTTRKRQRVASDGSVASKASSVVLSAVKAAKKVTRKVVSFLSPKKNTSTGTESDTPHRSSTIAKDTNTHITRSRSSSNASLSSCGSISSYQSSFQFNAEDDPVSIASEAPDATTADLFLEMTEEEQARRDLGACCSSCHCSWPIN
ncbi:hypothetical protein GGX14DRAFT_398781 [Mycena pura]|uniref:Uncharacterized protein n=1 Tax=Mycena pura TaxID=153505 RepID=A0AAD6Y7I9_9AGAR|nr:hypothetical protein GGX14DRAFT_398781 [Mycena pura]